MSNVKETESTHKKTFRAEDYVSSKDAKTYQGEVLKAAEMKLKTKLDYYVSEFKKVVFQLPPAEREDELKFLGNCWALQVAKVSHIVDEKLHLPKFNDQIVAWLKQQTQNGKKNS